MATLLRMPEISANTVEAVLAEWPLSENTAFAAGDAIATVETEKAVVDVPAEADGVLLRTLIEPGKSVPVGTPLAVLGAPGEAVGDLDRLVEQLTGEPQPAAIDGAAGDEARSTPAGDEARSTSAGDLAGETGAEAGSSPAGAREVSQAAGAGPEAPMDDAAAPIAGSGAPVAESVAPTAGSEERNAGAGVEVDGAATAGPAGAAAGRIFASPLARRMARENDLSIGDIRGTGPGGRIVRDDVRRALAAHRGGVPQSPPTRPAPVSAGSTPALAPAAPAPTSADGRTGTIPARATAVTASVPARAAGDGGYEDIPHSRMRRAIADRLAQSSRETPVFSIRGSARVDALLELRRQVNEAAPVKISVNDLIVAAVARAHVAVPEMNAVWTPDAVRRFRDVDIAVAVATDTGLVTPVVRDVSNLTVSALAGRTADLVARARAGRLRQDEIEGGTLTVTNLGAYGTEDFTAVINPPQAAILAVGAARQEAVVTDGALGVATLLRVTLSVDHRPVDGATAARWMAAFLALLEAPLRILV